MLYSDEDYQIVLCGGSGAGYAILNILNHINNSESVSALIWNPQISLSEYNLEAFKSYLKYCFPNLEPSRYKLKTELKELMSNNGIIEEVGTDINSKVLILMNEDDHKHLFKHVSLFIKNWIEKEKYTYGHNYLFLEDRVKIIFGCWGEGHAVPYRSDLKYFLNILLRDGFNDIEEEQTKTVPLHKSQFLTNDELTENSDGYWLEMLSVIYDKEECEIRISFDIDKHFSVFNLVYYVVYKGKAIKSKWNTKRTNLVFKVQSYPIEELKIRIYIRDIFGNQKIISKDVCGM